VPHVRRPALTATNPLHVTLRITEGLPSMREPVLLARIRRALRHGKDRFGLRVVHYSVQGNHLHLIVESSTRRALSRGMRGLGVRIARGVNGVLERRGCVIGDRYHARPLTTPRAVRNALAYVLLNASRHARRSVGLDAASSARTFDGWAPRVQARAGPAPPSIADTVVAPTVWLLRRGWRSRGLIDPAVVPGH
jgi:hypothetical protein